jgi:MGT family glycosyltransferase
MQVLIYTSPAKGHLYPVVPIARKLVERGHDVALSTLASEIHLLEGLGLDAEPVDERIEARELDDWRASSPPQAIVAAMSTFADRAQHEAPDLQRALAETDPDAVLVDVNCWGAATVAEASGRPWAIFAPYLLPLPSRDAPPFGLGLAPMGGPLGRARDALVGSLVKAIGKRYGVRRINPLRVAHGLQPIERFEDLLTRPPLLLAMTAEGFEYPRRDWPANVRLVGPMSWAPPEQAPDWLDRMPDPLVLVTCSTERQQDAPLIEAALAGLPAKGLTVLATSAAHDPSAFTAPPPSRVVGFVAHEPVLERAACVVCHGGMGITQKALAAGVPLVVVPFGRDQLETARRVEVAEAGLRLSPRSLSAARLAEAVQAAIALRPGAQRVAEAFAVAGGPTAAAEAIEGLGA